MKISRRSAIAMAAVAPLALAAGREERPTAPESWCDGQIVKLHYDKPRVAGWVSIYTYRHWRLVEEMHGSPRILSELYPHLKLDV